MPIGKNEARIMESIDDRIRALDDKAGLDELVKKTEIKRTRWRTVRYDKRTRISTQEVEALMLLYPSYALWLASGAITPESGQTSHRWEKPGNSQL